MAASAVGYVSGNNNAGGQDFTATPDGTIATDDWMVLVVCLNASQTMTVPTGWTAHYNVKTAGTLYTAMFSKKRTAGDGSYALHVNAGTLATYSLMWFRGVADTGWIVPADGRLRNTTGSSFNNIADPITTTAADTLVLTVSTERTSAVETDITSISGTNKWFHRAQVGSFLETITTGLRNYVAPATTDSVTIVYPNTQGSNGYAFQIGMPSADVTPPLPGLAHTRWSGTVETPVHATVWNGTAEVPLAAVAPHTGVHTITQLLAHEPFYIAHRGGGNNWPEHTFRSYSSAANHGLKAIEVSTQMTSDGVIVCHHDTSTLRMTGTDLTIASSTKAQLDALTNSAAFTDNPGQNREPIPTLASVLSAYAANHVLFIEPKSGGALPAAVMAAIDATPGRTDRIVWKQPINSSLWATAKAKGYATWGYVLSGDTAHTNNLDALINNPNLDMVGVERTASDVFVADIVARATAAGKRTIMWEIRSIVDRDRALALGCVGMMTANLRAVLPKFP